MLVAVSDTYPTRKSIPCSRSSCRRSPTSKTISGLNGCGAPAQALAAQPISATNVRWWLNFADVMFESSPQSVSIYPWYANTPRINGNATASFLSAHDLPDPISDRSAAHDGRCVILCADEPWLLCRGPDLMRNRPYSSG